MVTITSFRENSKRVDFEIEVFDPWEEKIQIYKYHTNDSGYGLWEGEDYLTQCLGTAQFRLTQKTRSGVHKAITRVFNAE